MMRRLVIAALALVAATTPAVVGLFGNASFVQALPVPSRTIATSTGQGHGSTAVPSPAASGPSDDHGGERPRDTSDHTSGDDHGGPGTDDDSATSGHPSDTSGSHDSGSGSGSGSSSSSSRHSGGDGSGSGDHGGHDHGSDS
jgi:hypothetical protein